VREEREGEHSDRHDDEPDQELRAHGEAIGHGQRFPEEDAAVLALGVQAVEQVITADEDGHEVKRYREHELDDREDRHPLRLARKVRSLLHIDVDAADGGNQREQRRHRERREPQRAVLPELAPHEREQDCGGPFGCRGGVAARAVGCAVGERGVHGRPVLCIFATNRSAIEGVRSSPRAPSSAAERPSKNIATRPNTSRS